MSKTTPAQPPRCAFFVRTIVTQAEATTAHAALIAYRAELLSQRKALKA